MKLTLIENGIQDSINSLNAKDIVLTQALKKGAEMSVSDMKDRIQNVGNDSDDNPIITRSANSQGRYSERHAKRRSRYGLQTGYVDLTFTGDMMDDLQVLNVDSESASVGFSQDKNFEISLYNEETFSTDIFIPSDQEAEDVLNYIDLQIEQLL